MNKTPAVLGMIAAFLLTGCAATSPTPSAILPSDDATPTADALPAVSLETTCDFLFGDDVDRAVPTATDIILKFVEDPDLSTVTEDELEETIDDLESASKNAADDVKPYINAAAAPLRVMLDALQNGANTEVSFEDYKVSVTEHVNRCRPFIEE